MEVSRIPIAPQFIALCVILVAFAALTGFLAATWPQFFFPALTFCWLVCSALEVRSQYRTIRILGEQFDQIEPNESATFVGLYRPHWEIGRIQIARAKRRFGFLPTFESWLPCFVADFPVDFDILDNDSNYLIRFVGTPTERGQFGHRGLMCRQIRITEFLDVKPIPKNAA